MSIRVNVKYFESLPDESKYIRETVFVDEQGFNEEFDTVDNYAHHFVAYDQNDNPVGTCRIFAESDPKIYYLGRLAVIKDARVNGVGRSLILAAEKKAFELGATELKLHSQCRAQVFYEKSGYVAYGEIELDEGCPHIWMKKVLNNA